MKNRRRRPKIKDALNLSERDRREIEQACDATTPWRRRSMSVPDLIEFTLFFVLFAVSGYAVLRSVNLI